MSGPVADTAGAKPRIGVIPGDPAGIGPELLGKLLADPQVPATADLLLIGDRCLFERAGAQSGNDFPLVAVADPLAGDWTAGAPFAWHETRTIAPEEMVLAEVSEAGGRASLRTLDRALELAGAGAIDAVLFLPFNKSSLHAAGLGHDDELHYMAERLGVAGRVSELNVMDGIWTSRVTSHIALRAVADAISAEGIGEAVRLIDRTLRTSGLSRPRIAVAALNPHAGDNGNFGREEIDVIAPAVEALASFANPDGGFGGSLEPDLRAPDSSALATSQALRMLRELGQPADHPLVEAGTRSTSHTRGGRAWRSKAQALACADRWAALTLAALQHGHAARVSRHVVPAGRRGGFSGLGAGA